MTLCGRPHIPPSGRACQRWASVQIRVGCRLDRWGAVKHRSVHNADVTAQVADSVELGGQAYAIAGVRGGPLFDPEHHRIKPAMISTACWRGYLCWYRVDGGSLRLVRLVIGSGSKVAGRKVSPARALLGSTLVLGPSWTGPGWEAAGLDVPVPFSGGLLLGQGFIRSTYVHMGFHPAWKFEKVVELLLEHGMVTSTLDRSAEVAVVRQRIESGEAPDPDGSRGGVTWVERTFSLDYSRSFPRDGK
jgi:hypothetical protein